MSEAQLETFDYGRGVRVSTYVILSRTTAEEVERGGGVRLAFWMRTNRVAAVVEARKLRGRKVFTFYQASVGGRTWYVRSSK